MRYDAYLFIEGIKTKHWLEMLQALDAALHEWRHAKPGAVTEDEQKFVTFLAATRRYLLGEGSQRPEGLDNSLLLLLKPLCEMLVASGRFAPESLEVFSELDAWIAPQPRAGRRSRRPPTPFDPSPGK